MRLRIRFRKGWRNKPHPYWFRRKAQWIEMHGAWPVRIGGTLQIGPLEVFW